MSPTSSIKIGLTAIVLIILFGYAYSRAESFLQGPDIEIYEPQNGASVSTPLITISAEIKNAAHITLNGRQVYTDETGKLSETLLLAQGYNVITVTALDQFKRTETKTIEIIYQ